MWQPYSKTADLQILVEVIFIIAHVATAFFEQLKFNLYVFRSPGALILHLGSTRFTHFIIPPQIAETVMLMTGMYTHLESSM